MARTVTDATLLTSLSTVDTVLGEHVSEMGHDFVPYRNHVYRVVNLCVAIVGGRSELEKIAVAAVFHDLGIWTNKTWDYLEPSAALARRYLIGGEHAKWIPEIERMIIDHHKITPAPATPDGLVESFRRADWVDVTLGMRRFGVPRPFIKSVYEVWPSAGFHWRLVQLTLQRFRAHPLTPLPMVRW